MRREKGPARALTPRPISALGFILEGGRNVGPRIHAWHLFPCPCTSL